MQLLYFIFPSMTNNNTMVPIHSIWFDCFSDLLLLLLLLKLVRIIVSDEVWLRGLNVSNDLRVKRERFEQIQQMIDLLGRPWSKLHHQEPPVLWNCSCTTSLRVYNMRDL